MSEVIPPVAAKPSAWQRFRRVPGLLRMVMFSLFCMLSAVAAFGAGMVALKFDVQPQELVLGEPNKSGHYEQVEPPEIVRNKNRLNILVLGVDYNHDSKSMPYSAGARSDTIMVVSLSKDGDVVNVLSIPRDLYIPLSESMGCDRINAAYSYGGVKQARETVSRFLGVPIHKHLIVKVHGAKKVIDALGGLELEVEKDMDYDDNWGGLHVHLKKGRQRLNGDQVVGYARFRKDNTRIDMEGDVGRMRRQQQVIRAALRALKSPETIGKIPQLASAVKETLETDLSVNDMADLARLYKDFDHKRMHGGQIKGDDAMVGEAMVLVPYEPENTMLVRRLLKDSLDFGLRDVRIRILNHSGEWGMANEMADDMTELGFNIVSANDSEGKPAKRTQVVVYTRCPRVQQRLKALLPDAQFRDSASPNPNCDIAITLGSDKVYLAKQPKPEPPSASRWAEPPAPPAKPRPRPKVEKPPEPPTEPAPLPTPEPDSPLRTDEPANQDEVHLSRRRRTGSRPLAFGGELSPEAKIFY